MPATALKHLAKKAKVSVDRAEHLWDKAKGIVKSEYDVTEDDPSFWALTMGVTKKMLGLSESITFKQFIAERAAGGVDDPRDVYSKSIPEAIEILNTHCRDALWMLKENRPIYRGESAKSNILVQLDEAGFATTDTAATARVSENESNYYTLILDNHPKRKQFPKRSRSYIASTNIVAARAYAGITDPMIIIPFDGTKIGMVNKRDMWDTRISLFGDKDSIWAWNIRYELMGLSDTDWQTFIDIDKRLKAGDKEATQLINDAFGYDTSSFAKQFLEKIYEAFSAESTGHTAVTTATMPHKVDSEVWVGGKVMLISWPMWKRLRDAVEAT